MPGNNIGSSYTKIDNHICKWVDIINEEYENNEDGNNNISMPFFEGICQFECGNEKYYLSEENLGKGKFGEVKLTIRVSDMHPDVSFAELMKKHGLLAVKFFNDEQSYKRYYSGLKVFIQAYKSHYPKNIEQLTGCHDKKMYFIMPLLAGSLHDFQQSSFDTSRQKHTRDQKQWILDKTKFSPIKNLTAIIAVLEAMKHFHQITNHAHLDVKIDNIQYDEVKEKAYFIDTDFSRKLPKGSLAERYGNAGTPLFQAPETTPYGNISHYNHTTDYYALAAVIIGLLGSSEDDLGKAKIDFQKKWRNFSGLRREPFLFDTTPLEKYLLNQEIQDIKTQVEELSAEHYYDRPSTLDTCIDVFSKTLNDLIERYRAQHRVEFKDCLAQMSFFNEDQKINTNNEKIATLSNKKGPMANS